MVVRRNKGDDGENDESDEDKEQVGSGTGQSGEVIVADNVVEVASENRSGLGPSDQHASESVESDEWAKDGDCREKECADGVDVLEGIECNAAKFAGGVIAEAGRGPGVGTFVDAEREKKKHEFEDGNDECAGFQLKAPRG